jgi:hypothetical protein
MNAMFPESLNQVLSKSARCDGPSRLTPRPVHPITFDTCWRNDATGSLAQHIYGTGNFGEMPLLADALERARCAHEQGVLNHVNLKELSSAMELP